VVCTRFFNGDGVCPDEVFLEGAASRSLRPELEALGESCKLGQRGPGRIEPLSPKIFLHSTADSLSCHLKTEVVLLVFKRLTLR